ncbi:uncharacterized protein ACA1_116490 [Acanthamoeba castellanii str. Neff]|uniref:SET domain-containing protein n=1 Tax=Acanthamoeba castellanii (strain ATCC 30010 / Neff) TaxID=1257118 RepID=L8H613_ACACF|nr:uncharacterized protein ACA1_116490 [Acanthamoeba castellanii str. Neff]ELR20178.1 hypothetical protein ACA1_116490 [Acanthamoeba castellanii str. Neff]
MEGNAVRDPGFRGLNPKVQVGNSGVEYPKHHGPESLGWHAAQDIRRKFEYTLSDIKSWPRERRRKFFRIAYQVDEEIYSGYHSDTDMTEQQKYEWHCNHSCEPNLWFEDKDVIVAMRDIAKAKSCSTTTPSPSPTTSSNSTASAAPPRRVTGKDYRLPELQARYGRHFMPYILAKIERERATA